MQILMSFISVLTVRANRTMSSANTLMFVGSMVLTFCTFVISSFIKKAYKFGLSILPWRTPSDVWKGGAMRLFVFIHVEDAE